MINVYSATPTLEPLKIATIFIHRDWSTNHHCWFTAGIENIQSINTNKSRCYRYLMKASVITRLIYHLEANHWGDEGNTTSIVW